MAAREKKSDISRLKTSRELFTCLQDAYNATVASLASAVAKLSLGYCK